MEIFFHKKFIKQLKKLSKKDQAILEKKLALFLKEPFHPKLRSHSLKGKYNNYHSIDIKPDLRAVYKMENKNEAKFIILGNHNQLYK